MAFRKNGQAHSPTWTSTCVKMDQRMPFNGQAHAIKWTGACVKRTGAHNYRNFANSKNNYYQK